MSVHPGEERAIEGVSERRQVLKSGRLVPSGRRNRYSREKSLPGALEVADELGAESLALPAFGTGVGGSPLEECARLMVEVVRSYEPRTLSRVVFAVFGAEAEHAFSQALQS
jgi:O-acetyl-ADP-ribose deacetylase (regulator of RNase III)